MKKNIIIAAVILLVLGFFVWRAQPKQVIKRQSKALISMADNVSDGVSMLDYGKLETLLGDRIEFEIEAASREQETAGGVEVISAYRWLGENVKKSDFKIASMDALEISGDKATVRMQVEGVLEMSEMRMMDGTYFVEFGWSKDDQGKWRLVRFIWK